MKKLSRREFLAVCGKALIVGIGLCTVPIRETGITSQAQEATVRPVEFHSSPHALPDFEAWMLSTAHIAVLERRLGQSQEMKGSVPLTSCTGN